MYQIETELSDKDLTIFFNGEEMLRVAVTGNGQTLQVAYSDDIRWVDRIRRAPLIKIRGRRSSASSSSSSSTPRPALRVTGSPELTTKQRSQIIKLIERDKDSAFIAEKVFGSADRHNVMRVAGVKASYTKGQYETV